MLACPVFIPVIVRHAFSISYAFLPKASLNREIATIRSLSFAPFRDLAGKIIDQPPGNVQ
jgi:hypothetical protein